MKWIGERISFVDDKQRSTVVIYPGASGWVKSAMGAWVSMWLIIGSVMTWAYFTFKMTEQEKIIVYVFMAFWAYYAIKVIRSLFWIMWGKELIKIDEVAFTYKKSIKKYGKAVPYYLENIKKMTLSQPKPNSIQAVWESSPWVQGGERLEFEYRGKLVRFGRKLEEKEAKLLFQVITKRIEDQLRKRKA